MKTSMPTAPLALPSVSLQVAMQRLLAITAASFCISFCPVAQAESDLSPGPAGPLDTTARLDFRITVPRMLFLRVGAGTYFADNAAVSRVTFAMTAAQIGSGAAVPATAPGAGMGATVRANGGDVTLSAQGVAGGLANGAQRIAWSQIFPSISAGTLPNPVIGNGVPGPASTLLAVAGVVNRSATYRFTYANGAPVAAGTYNGRVTYTAALP